MAVYCIPSQWVGSRKQTTFIWQCHLVRGAERCLLLVRVIISSNSNHRGSASRPPDLWYVHTVLTTSETPYHTEGVQVK